MYLGTMGFSYIGLIYVLMITIPNLVWLKFKPENYSTENENKVLVWFERIGQTLVTFVVLSFSDFNFQTFSFWYIFLILSFAIMILYEIWWIRYFCSKRRLKDFYSSILRIPLAGATLPIAGFLLLGIYGQNIWLIISVVILAIGHIGIHIKHKKEIVEIRKIKIRKPKSNIIINMNLDD